MTLDAKIPAWLKKRASGVHLHPTSLPGGNGVGCLGSRAFEWIDFLTDAGFSFWQMCPVGPTGYGDSPYQVFSSSAGNPYLIDLGPLLSNGLLLPDDIKELQCLSQESVDFEKLYHLFFPALRIAYKNFLNSPNIFENEYGNFNDFKSSHSDWLLPFAKYQAIKAQNELNPWWKWKKENIARTNNASIEENLPEYEFHIFLQYLFRGQWNQVHQYAKAKGISLIGDLPIYVAPDSADTWAHREYFQINDEGKFDAVAGVPPDYFNEDGQLWGNPLYNWDNLKNDGYEWWIKRIEEQLQLFEVIRIDHFRAFHDYWSIPMGSKTAKSGKWVKGPGLEFWNIIKQHFPELPFLAEDLGDISDGVRKLRTSVGLPGMAVMQFAFNGNPRNLYLPHNLTSDLVLYTGTHDNDTSCGWYNRTDEGSRSFFRGYLNVDGSTPGWDMLRNAYRSKSQLVVVPCQDLLSLGSEARFNTPGQPYDNWNWRMTPDQFSSLRNNSTQYLREQALITDRLSVSLS